MVEKELWTKVEVVINTFTKGNKLEVGLFMRFSVRSNKMTVIFKLLTKILVHPMHT